MKIIKKLRDISALLDIDVEGIEVIKDVLLQAYIFEKCFEDNAINEAIILEPNEPYKEPDIVPELEEDIGNYHKRLYITCDSGEGIVIYRRMDNNHE